MRPTRNLHKLVQDYADAIIEGGSFQSTDLIVENNHSKCKDTAVEAGVISVCELGVSE